MKVMITVPWGRRIGGGETMLVTFLRSVNRGRFEPVVVFFEHGPLVDEVASLGLEAFVVPVGRLRQPVNVVRTVVSLTRLLRREQPDLLLNWMAKTHLYGASAAILAGRPDRVVWWQHGIAEAHWLDRLATLLPAHAVGCSSKHSAAAQASTWPHRRVFVVHPGIEPPAQSDDANRGRLRDGLGIPPERLVVGMVGRVEPGKRHDDFLEVIAALVSRGLPVHGLVVGGALPGDGSSLMDDLSAAVRRRGLDEIVTLTGHVDDACVYIELMDVLVSVASEEAFGIALLEAMALGVPVVARAIGGPQEIIETGKSGLLVPASRLDEVADAVERVLDDGHLRDRLRAGAAARFRAHFAANRMTAELEGAIAELCAT
jgi:glycosyltransferase involved in cell wall biosynthesis